MYSCKVATEMVEKKNIVGLSFIESLKLKLHLSICKACKSYKKQSEFVDTFLQKENLQEEAPFIENNELKSSIISKLNEG